MTAIATYSTGTVSVANGDTAIVGVSTIWSGVNASPGDDIVIAGHTVIIKDVTDTTHLVIDAWPYTSVTAGAAYEIIQRSPLRFAGGQAMQSVNTLVAALNTSGFYVFVDITATVPDPSLGDDGQYAFQATTGKLWLKTGGVWVFVGIYKGINPLGAWSGSTAYNANDIVTLSGSSYICILAHTNHTPPNATYWVLLASVGSTGSTGPTGAGYGGTSTTSLTIGTGSKTFTTQAGLAYAVSSRMRAASNANGANYMEGLVTAYSGTSLTINMLRTGGSGTLTDWNLSVAGDPGSGDMLSTNNLSDVANAATSLNNLNGASYGATQSLTSAQQDQARVNVFAAPADISCSPLLYNGAFTLDQVNEGTAAYTAANNGEHYSVDQLRICCASAAAFTVKRDTVLNAGFKNNLTVTLSTQKGSTVSTDNDHLEWAIGGDEIAQLGLGTAQAKPFTVSLKIAASFTGDISLAILLGNNSASVVKTFNIPSTGTVYDRSVTFPALTDAMLATLGATLGTNKNDFGIKLLIDLGSGSAATSGGSGLWTAGADWAFPGAVQFTRLAASNVMYISGMQFDVGSIALPYRHIHPDLILRKAQRYLWKTMGLGTAFAQNAGYTDILSYVSSLAGVHSAGFSVKYPTEMISAPTITTANPAAANANWRNASISADSGVPTIFFAGTAACTFTNPQVSGDTAGSIIGIHALFDARLGGP